MSLKIAACQVIRGRNAEENVSKAKNLIEKIKKEYNPDLICFPETYPISFKGHEGDKGTLTQILAETCAKNNVDLIFGKVTSEEGLFYNSAVTIDNNGYVINRYDKKHLFANDKERYRYKCGNDITKIKGYNIGFAVCYDLYFQEHLRLLTLKDADVIIGLTSVPKKLKSFWKNLIITRTFENYTPFVNVSDVSKETCGITIITQPPFCVVNENLTSDKEEIIYAEISPELFRKERKNKSPNISGSILFEENKFIYPSDLNLDTVEELGKTYRLKNQKEGKDVK